MLYGATMSVYMTPDGAPNVSNYQPVHIHFILPRGPGPGTRERGSSAAWTDDGPVVPQWIDHAAAASACGCPSSCYRCSGGGSRSMASMMCSTSINWGYAIAAPLAFCSGR